SVSSRYQCSLAIFPERWADSNSARRAPSIVRARARSCWALPGSTGTTSAMDAMRISFYLADLRGRLGRLPAQTAEGDMGARLHERQRDAVQLHRPARVIAHTRAPHFRIEPPAGRAGTG